MKLSVYVAVALVLIGAVAAVSVAPSRFTLAPKHVVGPMWQHVDRAPGVEHEFDIFIGLHRRNVDKMDAHFWAASTPTNPLYGEHLGNEEIRSMISPGKAVVDRVSSWLVSFGISASRVKVSPHEDSLRVEGVSESQLTTLFGADFDTYMHKASPERLVRRATGPITLPSEFRGVIEVVTGYRGFPLEPRQKNAAPNVGQWTMPPARPYVDPAVIYDVYNMSVKSLPTQDKRNVQSFFQAQGQNVRKADLKEFCDKLMDFPEFDKSKCKITKYVGKNDKQQPGVESELDSQYITATGFGTETWVWAFPGVDFCSDLLSWGQSVFEHDKDRFPYVISMSYGAQGLPTFCETSVVKRFTQDTQKMGTMGISVIVASGDSGSGELSREGYNGGLLHGAFPSDTPFVTAVGATTFVDGGSHGEQMATTQFGSGGGFAYQTARPAYQADAVETYFERSSQLPPPLSYNKNGRGTPDIAALGEGFQVFDDNKVTAVGGTSCAAPTFAGMVSQLNNIRLQKGKTMGFLNPVLYANPNVFTDITLGSNDIHGDGLGWYTASGWDPVTGLGTPNFARLAELVRKLP